MAARLKEKVTAKWLWPLVNENPIVSLILKSIGPKYSTQLNKMGQR